MVNNVKFKIKETREKLINTKDKINSISFDAHWYRRVFHTFGASFVFYYMLPELEWIDLLKIVFPTAIVIFAISLELLRLKGFVSSNHFFGLRMYEKKRIGSYVFFALGILILLMFFPQQIAIPCILCACLGDPIIGEVRNHFDKKFSYFAGFILCMSFFMIAWYKAHIFLFLIVSIVGGLGALIGETKKFYWLDDDFLIQILPAILVLIIWFAIPYLGFNYPDLVIYPFEWPWGV